MKVYLMKSIQKCNLSKKVTPNCTTFRCKRKKVAELMRT